MISLLSAAAANAASPPAYLQFLPLVAMAVIFWFLILRPQMKRRRNTSSAWPPCRRGPGDHRRGLVGKIVRLDDPMSIWNWPQRARQGRALHPG
jgi:preprotein translocase subunit YajC